MASDRCPWWAVSAAWVATLFLFPPVTLVDCLEPCLGWQLIWRFFRLWALLDGVDTIENMARCMSNNYTISGRAGLRRLADGVGM